MGVMRFANPVFLYRRRGLVGEYVRNYAGDFGRWLRQGGIELRARVAECGWGLTANDRRFAALKGVHAGRRGFIIGNGPSLRLSDLERLTHEVTFAANRIYVCFKDTAWRPSYYVTSYLDREGGYYDDVDRIDRSMKLLPLPALHRCRPVRNAVYFRRFHEWFYPERPRFASHAMRGVYFGGTIVYEMIQLAWYMGLRELYLLGVDFNYQAAEIQTAKVGDKYVSTGASTDYFHPGYHRPGEKAGLPMLDWQLKAFEAAKAAIETEGGRLFNATRGGHLDVFPRVDFDAVVPPPLPE